MATNNFEDRLLEMKTGGGRSPHQDQPEAGTEPTTKPLPGPYIPKYTFEQARAIWRAIESFPDDGEEEDEDVD